MGAIPPVMGYAAASNGIIFAPEPAILSSILFLWQFPHFFALSWLHRQDYALGGFQMVPVNDALGIRTAALIQEYSLYLTALPILTSILGYTSYMFAIEGLVANAYLLRLVYKFKQDKSNANARKIFLCSLWYLPVLLIGYAFHAKTIENKLESENINHVSLDTSISTLGTTDRSKGEEQSIEDEDKNILSLNIVEKLKLQMKTLFKQVCIHEMIAYWNTHKSSDTNNNNFPNSSLQTSTSTLVPTTETTNTSNNDTTNRTNILCMKIKSEHVS